MQRKGRPWLSSFLHPFTSSQFCGSEVQALCGWILCSGSAGLHSILTALGKHPGSFWSLAEFRPCIWRTEVHFPASHCQLGLLSS